MASDESEFWGGYIPDKSPRTPERNKKVQDNYNNGQKINREFRSRYPSLSKSQVRKLAIINGGYANISGKKLEELKPINDHAF